jgi:hypothetical protein
LDVLDAVGKEQTIECLRVSSDEENSTVFPFFDPLAEKVEFCRVFGTRLSSVRNKKGRVSVISGYLIGNWESVSVDRNMLQEQDSYLLDVDLNARLVAKTLQQKLYPLAARLVEESKKKSIEG